MDEEEEKELGEDIFMADDDLGVPEGMGLDDDEDLEDPDKDS